MGSPDLAVTRQEDLLPPAAPPPAQPAMAPVAPVVVDRAGNYGTTLVPPVGQETRPAATDYAMFQREWRLLPRLTGDHGVIADPPDTPGMEGGQMTVAAWSPRTMRHEPTPWDGPNG